VATASVLPLPLKLFRDLFVLSKQQKAVKVLLNFQLAGLHLVCMFKGTANRADHLVNYFLLSLTTIADKKIYKKGHPKFPH